MIPTAILQPFLRRLIFGSDWEAAEPKILLFWQHIIFTLVLVEGRGEGVLARGEFRGLEFGNFITPVGIC